MEPVFDSSNVVGAIVCGLNADFDIARRHGQDEGTMRIKNAHKGQLRAESTTTLGDPCQLCPPPESMSLATFLTYGSGSFRSCAAVLVASFLSMFIKLSNALRLQ